MIAARLTDLAAYAARRFGNSKAFTVPGSCSLGFTDLNDRIARCAGGLSALGISPGDRVVLHLPNGLEWIIAYHAIARMGGVVAPANILLSAEEVDFIVRDSEARAIIVSTDRCDHFKTLPCLLIAVGAQEGPVRFETLLEADPLPPVERSPDDLFTIGYTSGTTGKPKGAMLSHGNIFASLAATATIHVRHEHDVVLSSLPFPHVYGNIVMNAMFLAGTRLVSTARFDAGEALRLIKAEQVTLFEGVPTMYYQMLAHSDCATADLSSLTRCTVGGQTMPLAKIEAVAVRFGCPLLELWGMTELGGPAITHSPYWPSRYGSIGLPVPGMQARVANMEDPSRDASPGEAGELMVRGAQVISGYWKNEDATTAAIDGDGWLATGDIARCDTDGYFQVVDRKKDLIITAGYNVYPAELEQVIAMHPAVAMTAVAGLDDPEKGELACAFIVLHTGAEPDEADILAHCRRHLAAYKVPRRVYFVADLPKTSTGKILRRQLGELLSQLSRGLSEDD